MDTRSELLQFIMKNDGKAGFHQIVRRFGVLDANLNLVDEVEALLREGLIEQRQLKEGVQPNYFLTDLGRKAMMT